MKFTRSITCLLITALLAASFTGCGASSDNKTSSGTTSADVSDDNSSETIPADELDRSLTPDDLPDGLDFEGKTVTIHVRGDEGTIDEFSSEQTGDIIDDAIYKRNTSVEERLNITLSVYAAEGWENYDKAVSNLRATIFAGDDSYDLVAGWSARIPQLAIEGCFLNLYDVPYLNLEQPWWVQSLVDELTIADHLYFCTGDIVLTVISPSYVFYFNKSLAEKYLVPDLYETVLDGKWTIDYMSELAKTVSSDLNGDTIMDDNDLYGCVITGLNNVDGFLQSSGIKMITKDSDGYPVFNMEYDKINTLVEKIYTFMYENTGVLGYQNEGSPYSDTQIAMFKNDQVLFIPNPLSNASSEFKDMDSDYGIIPYPKFDEAQEQYLTRIQDALALMCVPITNSNIDCAGATLEAMSAESYRNVTSTYFEVAMKVKYSRDDVSSQMLDIVRDGAYVNFASVYNESIGKPWFVMRTLMSSKSKDFASWYSKNESTIQSKLATCVESFQELG